MDTAIVEDKIHAGKLLPRLLGFQIELHHPLVTCQQTHGELQEFLTSVRRLLKECAHVALPWLRVMGAISRAEGDRQYIRPPMTCPSVSV